MVENTYVVHNDLKNGAVQEDSNAKDTSVQKVCFFFFVSLEESFILSCIQVLCSNVHLETVLWLLEYYGYQCCLVTLPKMW